MVLNPEEEILLGSGDYQIDLYIEIKEGYITGSNLNSFQLHWEVSGLDLAYYSPAMLDLTVNIHTEPGYFKVQLSEIAEEELTIPSNGFTTRMILSLPIFPA